MSVGHLVLATVLCAPPAQAPAGSPAPRQAEGPSQDRGGKGHRGRKDKQPVGVLSEGGTDRGVLELGLGSVTLATAAGLIAVGSVQIVRGLDKEEACSTFDRPADCDLDPPALNFAAAGLSFGVMIPLIVAGSLWLRKGILINRDWRAVRAAESLSFNVRANGRSFGLGVSGRF